MTCFVLQSRFRSDPEFETKHTDVQGTENHPRDRPEHCPVRHERGTVVRAAERKPRSIKSHHYAGKA